VAPGDGEQRHGINEGNAGGIVYTVMLPMSVATDSAAMRG
jgi:hypothetical protein